MGHKYMHTSIHPGHLKYFQWPKAPHKMDILKITYQLLFNRVLITEPSKGEGR